MAVAEKHGLLVIEDAAQGIMCSYKGRPLGSIGHLSALSFHETKNIQSGEGGALLINDPQFVERAEIIREKGTNRGKFFRGQVDKYTWVDVGSSYLPSEIIAAFLYAQMEHAEEITSRRLLLWDEYHARLAELEQRGKLRRPVIPAHVQHNAHMYYILLPDLAQRSSLLKSLNSAGIKAVFHYVPLHSSPAGEKYGRKSGEMRVTNEVSERLVRLPLFCEMKDEEIDMVGKAIREFYSG